MRAETQVQPFHLVTPDNETLYGWHLMPLHLCHEHEEGLMEHPPSGPAEDYTQTNAFKLLAENPNARVVVSCMCSNPSCYLRQLGLNEEIFSPRECRSSWLCPAACQLQRLVGSFHPLASNSRLCP